MKLVWRNKRRFVVVMSGIILAVSIIGALFLVASNQSHVMGLSYLYQNRQPISVTHYSSTSNLTEFQRLDDLVLEADSLGTNVVEKVSHDLSLTPLNPETHEARYFLTKNQTINWTTLVVNTTEYQEFMFNVEDDFIDFEAQFYVPPPLRGRLPTLPKEIMVNELLASRFNLTLNDTISLGNRETERLVLGYKVVGIIGDYGNYIQYLFMLYSDFMTLYMTGNNDVAYMGTYMGYAELRVQIDLSTASIFNINEIAEKVQLLADRIKAGLEYEGLDFSVYNSMGGSEETSLTMMLFMLAYLLLMIGMLLPTLILAGHISKTIGTEMFERRSTEFSQFRSRGFSRQQMIKVLSSEVLVSSVLCSVIAGGIGIGISYLFQPIAATFVPLGEFGSGQDVFTPFTFPETGSMYVAIVVGLALLFVLGTYAQPIRLSFQREMIDSLKEKIKSRHHGRQIAGGIVFMYLLGGIPLGLYILLMVLPPDQAFTQGLITISPLISGLTIASPFFISLATIKYLGEKKPGIFAKLCTAPLFRSNTPLRHITRRNIVSKTAKLTRLSMIVLFTVAFGFLVKTTFSSLVAVRQEKMQIVLGSDISGHLSGTIGVLDAKRAECATMANVTRSSFVIQTLAMIDDTSESVMKFHWITFDLLNLTEYIDTISVKDDKYLYGTTWSTLAGQVVGNPDLAVLPSTLEAYVHGTSITVKIWIDNGTAYKFIQKTYEVAGYYKAFPGLVQEVHPSDYTILLNENPWQALQNETRYLKMIVCIKTPFEDQKSIDDAAATMNLTAFTLTSLSEMTNSMGMVSLIDMPIFYDLLDIDNWLMLSISLFGIAIISFMLITKERKELGLRRIRGFDSKLLYKTLLTENFVPILIGGLIGVVAGILGGWLTTTAIALNFQVFNPVWFYPINLVITGVDVLLQAIIPIVLYVVVILISIKNEIRQNLSSVMDEED